MSATVFDTIVHSPMEGLVSEAPLTEFLTYPDPDVIIRSSDLRELPLRKVYVAESSPVLRELIQAGPSAVHMETSLTLQSGETLPIIQLPDRAEMKMCLAPEYMLSARLTLHHPMTFEFLGEDMQLFEGNALYELAQFRKWCRDSLLRCFGTFLDPNSSGTSAWARETRTSSEEDPPQVGTEETTSCKANYGPRGHIGLPWWLRSAFDWAVDEMEYDFTSPLPDFTDVRSKMNVLILGGDALYPSCK
ncbi:hypothetical protein BC834DRAFT_883653 [Gloeopeniophorella convolvens]|nr:hypothetical protein BC834DRAFT_883653 [Gloeopeniophorella convolvens]